jgi:hypothetical protein
MQVTRKILLVRTVEYSTDCTVATAVKAVGKCRRMILG